MSTFLSAKTHTARKEHYCDGAEWLTVFDYRLELNLTFSEWRYIAKLKANGWKIMPGDEYIEQVGIWEGDFYSVKTTPELHNICSKYDLYPDDY